MKLNIKLLKNWLPKRKTTDNKSRGGRALILAGSYKMPGAGVLAAKAASAVGAGYIYTSTREVLRFFPEIIPWNDQMEKINSVLIGSGSGLNARLVAHIRKLKKTSVPVVIDADALTLAAQKKLYPFPSHWIATPHTGELSKFLNMTADNIQNNRLKSIKMAQKKLNCIVVLKGYRTLVASKDQIWEIPTGNVSLAKAGSGDVLAGMICGFLAQGVAPEKSTLLATYIHGLIADEWIKLKNDYLSLTPSELLNRIPKAIYKLRRN